MSKDLSQHLQALDEYRQRARETLATVRCELAAWFRDFFRKKKGPAKATHLNFLYVIDVETPQQRWVFSWHPGTYSRNHQFIPSQPIPVFTTEADALAVGLLATEAGTLLGCAHTDMVAEAWEQADGFSFPRQLMIISRAYESPDARRHWIEYTQEEIRKEVQGTRRVRPKSGLGPPEPLGLPAVAGETIEAVRSGDATALTDWAEALERAGASEAAGLLRWLPRFHALLAEEVRAVSPQFGFAIIVNPSGTAWWWIGDSCSESDNAEARQLGRLLSAWNETHPALEWLLRNFGFPHVAVEAIHYATDENAGTSRYDLTAGQHLGPVEEGARVFKLGVPGWEPIEGDS